ncbi:zinc finger protein basonuclin-1-like [Synchiropus picturatus]
MYDSSQVEIVHSNVVFDICSLMLYGTQAIPIRLKILLDRLFSVLKQEEVSQILNALDWTLQDYIRGYILQLRSRCVVCSKKLFTLYFICIYRHSGNLKLHYKQLTKDTVQSEFLKSSSNCGYTDLTYCQDPNVIESNIPSLVFSGGQNCIGQVFPRKEIIQIKVPDSSNTSPIVEDEMVLDLSTSSCRPPKGKSESACEGGRSDGAECLEEDKDQLIIEESDESCDYVSVGKDEEEDCTTGRLGNHCTIGRQQFGLQGLGNGPPITCHICHKVYSNKGTFRAHYKTVHLRLLHKCKVPGCDTSFSSVRSRNRHSQNPNLHKNLAIMSGLPIKQD